VHDHGPFLIDRPTVDALWFMPPLKTEDCCGGVCDSRYARDTRNPPGIKELAQAGSEMVPPLVIATAQSLQAAGQRITVARLDTPCAARPG
jgi:hypothetical protein